MWGEKIKIKNLVISLMLLCLVMLSAGAAFAASDDAILSEVSDDVSIEESNLGVSDTSILNEGDTLLSTSDDVVLAEPKDNVVTNDTFFYYFDENGTLLSNVTSDELIFEGDFSNVGVNYITIGAPIKFIGDGAEFEGVSFVIASDNVVVDGFTVTQTSDVSAFTAYGVSNVTLSNNIIDYAALDGFDSYAVYAKLVEDFTLVNNTIYYVGNTNGTVYNNAVRIEGNDDKDNYAPSRNIVVSGNTFDLKIPGVDWGYDSLTGVTIVYNDGVVFYYCEDVQFVDNHVTLKYNDYTSKYNADTVHAVSVRSNAGIYDFDDDYELIYPVQSKDILIANNTVAIDGHACAYAIVVSANGFEISGNTINTTTETYNGHGIDILSLSYNGAVFDNVVGVNSPVSYGIYSEGIYYGPVDSVTYLNNTVIVNGYLAVGMELLEEFPHVINNTVIATGNYTYGVVASIRQEGEISGNNITVLGSNIGSDAVGDPILSESSMAIDVKGDCLIANNTVASTDVGINLVEEGKISISGNTIDVISNTGDIDNYAIAAKKIGDLIISNNNITYVGAATSKGNETAKAYAVYVVNSTVAIADNTIDITVPSLPNYWEEVPPGSWNYVRHSFSEGIVFDGCDASSLSNNNITLGYSEGVYGSIYVVEVLGSDDFLIDGNKIIGTGEGYLYGIIIEGKNFNISNNVIYSVSNAYANGIDIEGTSNGVIDLNTITADADDSSYSIYGGMTGPVSCEITNNKISGNAFFGVGIELGGENLAINGNTIVLEGNYTIAVGVNVGNLTVNKNTIISNATNTGDASSIWDSVGTNTTGIKSKKGNAEITNNNISTTGDYAVDIADSEGTVNDNYLVSDKFLGDASVYSIGNATVYNNAPILTCDLEKVFKDGQVLNVTVVDVLGEPMSDVVLIANVGSIQVEATTDDDGKAVFLIDKLTPGEYVATIKFADSSIYDGAVATANVVVTKADTVITAPDVSVAYKDSTGELVATIKNVYGSSLGVNLNVEINGENYTVKANSKGQVSVPIGVLTPGNYTATISYAGNMNYNPSNTTATIVVDRADTVILVNDTSVAYENPSGKLVATIKNVYGNGLAVNVNVNLDGENYTIKAASSGKIIIPTADLAVGSYVATISYAGNVNYNSSNATATIVVNKAKSQIIAPDTTYVEYKDPNGEFVANLTSIYGNAIMDNVTVSIKGQTYTVQTDSNGQFSVPVEGLSAGNYVAKISYKGNNDYKASSANANIVVTKADAIITAPDVSVAYKNTTGELVANITNAYGKPLRVNLDVNFNGENYTIKTDSNGQISIPIGVLTPGTYAATISYAGNVNYNPVTTTANVIVNKADTVIVAPDVSVAYKDANGELVATITNVYGKPISVNVNVNINGVDYTVKSDSKGKINISTLGLAPGNYTATISYAGNVNYNPVTTTANVIVNKADTVITAKDVTVKCGDENGKLVATLKNVYGNSLGVNVIVNLDGQDYVIKADSKGKISLSTAGLAPGNYTATISYNGNVNYNPTSTTANVVVEQ